METRKIYAILLPLIIPLFAYGTEVNNPSMEGAFISQPPLGDVAEYWTGWRDSDGDFDEGSYAHDGTKSQELHWNGSGYEEFGPDGIHQQISSLQAGQAYQLSVWFKFRWEGIGIWADDGSITCSVGADPNGGTNPDVVTNWTSVSDSGYGYYEGPWFNVATFFSPNSNLSTIFIKVNGYGHAEDEEPCPEPPCPPMPAPWDAYCYIDDVLLETFEIGQGSTIEATSPVPADGINYSSVTITVLDPNGGPVEGIPGSEITVQCTGGGNIIIGPKNCTDAAGQTTAKVKSTVAEAKVVGATVLGTLLTDTADVVFEAVAIGEGSSVEATSPIPANGASYSEITITVLDSNGDPFEGIPPSGITVSCSGSGNTVLGPDQPTDENGQTKAKIRSTVAETKEVSTTVLGTVLTDTALVEFREGYFGPNWYVDASNLRYGDGSSEHPFRTISEAMLPVQNSDTIIVQEGVYYENVDFSGKEITIRSTDPNSNAVVQATIIDANGNGSVVSFKNGETTDSVIFGLTITGGYPPGYQGKGGGIFTEAASPTISNCIIRDNSARYGGGIYCGANSNPEIIRCTISGNWGSGHGGGFYCDADSNSTITDSTIIENRTGYSGGGLVCGQNSKGIITNCTIRGNLGGSYGHGGGISCWTNSSFTITSCTIVENSSGKGYDGGGIYCGGCDPNILNCTISDNWTNYGGGGIACLFASPTVSNCTITGNSASGGGGIECDEDSHPEITNCTIRANSSQGWGGGILCNHDSSPIITGCKIIDNQAGSDGGGISCAQGYQGGIDVLIKNCAIRGNSATDEGGGIYCAWHSAAIMNCAISENSASNGGGISSHGYYTNPTITNSTLSKNSADYGGGIFCYYHSSTTIYNCIFWADSGSNGPEIALLSTSQPATLSVYNSDIEGGSGAAYVESGCTLNWGTGNIDSNPLFMNTTEGDLHLKSTSPCIDMGNNGYVPIELTTDIDGDNRIIDGNLDSTATVDIGADEYRPDLESNPRPTLDPMAMQYVGVHEVNGVPTIRLCAAEASIPGQPGGDVEYMFESPTGACQGPDSGWQSSPAFNAAPVVEGTLYAYHVKARNATDPTAETSWSETATIWTIIGDLDGDRAVNFRDYAFFALRWLDMSCSDSDSWCSKTDLDKSGDVNLPDLKIFSGHWLE